MQSNDYLVMKGICKSFSSVKVLKDCDFSVRKGEIHGFLGGNGAGKSTFMNILGGIYSKDAGEIFIDGKKVEIANPMQSMRHGISFIHQELKLFSMRSVADNIYMSSLPIKGFGLIDDKKENEMAKEWLERIELDVSPQTFVEDLSIAERQMVEIAKALSIQAQIFIFDEPTSSQTRKETQILFRIIRKLRDEGASIIFISHKFDEVFELCDRVTVLRDGKNVGTVNVAETNADELVNMVVGIRLEQYYPEVKKLPLEETALEVTNFRNRRLNDVSFSLKKGEVLGLFGLVGAGRSELARAIFGLDYISSGELRIYGKTRKITSPKEAMKNRIGFLTEDRRGEGLVLGMDINSNLNIPILKQLTIPVVNFLMKKKMDTNTRIAFDQFNIVASGPRQRVRLLSGGNQQKIVLGKWFLTDPDIFILDEPTRGVDIKVKADLYEQIVDLAASGRSVLFISSEAPELIGISHRILVMRNGRITGEYMRGDVTEEQLVRCAMGGEK
ncbi:MAG: sugar ABC transporter ATP-binding protein [Clostridiales bacterium]|nr:sugar ABC transporter ATP-binding protein [Clostridiales bacterium]